MRNADRRNNMDYKDLEQMAKESGFTNTAELDVSTIELKQEVRDMCSKNKCGAYGTTWSCPPGCGTLEECAERIHKFKKGILVQTVGQLEDSLDGEGMMRTAHEHAEHVNAMQEKILAKTKNILTLGAGGCKLCSKCTYPDAPCRQPEKMHSSMESYGMVVMEVCKANNLGYYYGSDHIAYTGCFLYE